MSTIRVAALCGFFVIVPVLALADDVAPVALNKLSQPPKIASMPVLDQQGHLLGHAKRLVTDQDGKPAGMSFRAAKTGQTVVLSAAAVSYDGHILVTSSDQPQIAFLSGTRTAEK